MARFVLIHGAWQGAWCWREIVPRLAARGHDVAAIDLPGHGEDRSPIDSLTLQDYVDSVITTVQASQELPIVVVHSMGGVASQVAESLPTRIKALIYVAGLLPPSGSSMMRFVEGFDPDYLAQFLWAENGRGARIQPEGVKRFLYSQCPAATVESVLPLFTEEPVAPFATPLSLTGENFGSVPRHYIECLQDRVVPIDLQRAMRSAVPFDSVFTLDTGHSPFFSAPEELAGILHEIADQAT